MQFWVFQLLAEQLPENATFVSYIKGIQSSSHNLLHLIDDILDLSKVEAGKLEIELEPVDVRLLLDDVQNIFSVQTADKGLSLTVFIDRKVPSFLLLDEKRLRQILFNLIGNAIKFTQHGGVNVTIRCRDESPVSNRIDLLFEVTDTGIGIAPDQQSRIFEPFRRVKNSSLTQPSGIGLGLAITKRLVSIMGGTINFESNPEHGSTFRVRLIDIPIVLMSVPNNEMPIRPPVEKVKFNPATILMVEDVESNRAVIKGYLENQSLTLLEAENGLDALTRLDSGKPDLILMDLQMPVMDGYETINAIRKNPRFQSVPIVSLTAYAMRGEAIEIQKVCDGYLRKPITKVELFNELIRFLPYHLDALGRNSNSGDASEELTFDWSVGRVLLNDDAREKFKHNLVAQWEQVQRSMSVGSIQHFAGNVRTFSQACGWEQLGKYADVLTKQCVAFDTSGMKRTLSIFNEIKNNI